MLLMKSFALDSQEVKLPLSVRQWPRKEVPQNQSASLAAGRGEREFDLSNPKERKDFINNIEEGKVEEIEVVQNPLKFSADLGLWSLVIFVALLLILGKFAWAPMVEGLQKREHSIRLAVDEAKLAAGDRNGLGPSSKRRWIRRSPRFPR